MNIKPFLNICVGDSMFDIVSREKVEVLELIDNERFKVKSRHGEEFEASPHHLRSLSGEMTYRYIRGWQTGRDYFNKKIVGKRVRVLQKNRHGEVDILFGDVIEYIGDNNYKIRIHDDIVIDVNIFDIRHVEGDV